MKWFLLIFCILTSCTLRVDTRSDAQIEKESRWELNKKIAAHCLELCRPYDLAAIDPLNHSCLCKVISLEGQ